MKNLFILSIFCSFAFLACSDDSSGLAPQESSSSIAGSSAEKEIVAVDYSLGRKMNERLGKGINLGNSWDSKNYSGDIPDEPYNYGYGDPLDDGWSNPIEDGDFKIIKEAGFNSVRIPVRWQLHSDPVAHTVSPERLSGVKEDIALAIQEGLAVVVDFHWYAELMEAANNFHKNPVEYTTIYENEKTHFFSLWNQISAELNVFPDSMLVLEILNEPTMINADILNDLLLGAYSIIRANAPNKTIMFESNQSSKFYQLELLKLPQDGNIIYSGHYYEPYTFTHEGHGYSCVGDESYENAANTDLLKYVTMAQKFYPDINGSYIPLNMGEFGVSRTSCGEKNPSNKNFLLWNSKTIKAAEKYGMSWHYWCFTKCGGFESYDRSTNSWIANMTNAFFQE